MARTSPPRFVVRTTVATLIMVAGVLTAVFVGVAFDVRERVRGAVRDKLDAGQRMLSALEERRAQRAQRAGRDARREPDAQGRGRYLSGRDRNGQRGVPARDAGDDRPRARETGRAHQPRRPRRDRSLGSQSSPWPADAAPTGRCRRKCERARTGSAASPTSRCRRASSSSRRRRCRSRTRKSARCSSPRRSTAATRRSSRSSPARRRSSRRATR